jgi:integrase/recombinase XerD
MKKLTTNPLPALVQSFFAHYLIHQRQLSPCTIASYRDCLRLLLAYVQKQTGRQPTQQRLEDWNAPRVLGFLDHLEKQRHCCARSRNARLAAIHCFMRYASQQEPVCLTLANQVLAIPNKRQSRPLLGYLTPAEVQAVLGAPSPDTFSGQRDRLLFQLLYNTGARASEIVALNRQDLLAGSCQTVTLHGKGRKQRTVPLWPKTSRQLRHWLQQLPAEPSTPIFRNRFGARLSRFGLEKQLAQAVRKAAVVCPSLRGRRVSPHILRHTTAMHLLQAGVDITAIALWLGHESPVTTHQYIEADLEMKKQTLNRLAQPKGKAAIFKPRDKLLAFLEGL